MTPEPFAPLQTERLVLRCVTVDDAAATSALMTPQVSRGMAHWPVPFSNDMAIAKIIASRKLAYAGDALPLAIVEQLTGVVLGWAMVHRDPQDRRRGSLGYWLGEAHHGHGYMRELAPVVIAAGFELLNLDVIEAAAQPANIASLAVMRGCGMVPTRSAMVYAPARERNELCAFYEIRNSIK